MTTTPAQQAAERIALALEKGPTPGPWLANLFTSSFEIVTPGDFEESMTLCTRYSYDEKASEMLANGELIAAANPSALRALLAERDELRKALEAMVREFGYDVVHPKCLVHDEHEAIRSALAALTKDN